ncbi:pyroglutamyl-peptidase 1-like protein [Aphelenchoides avenae]|nr:pyroglutamyl-peptidase 1-like protein [Aphelenchus avenae]
MTDIKGNLPCCHLLSNQTRISSVLDFTQLANEVIDSGSVSSHLIMSSYDPGNYLCGYIYYQSLLLEEGRALFVHVPNFTERLTPEVLTEALHGIVLAVVKQVTNGFQAW